MSEQIKEKIKAYVNEHYRGSLKYLTDKVLLKIIDKEELVYIKKLIDNKIQTPSSLMIYCFFNDIYENPKCVCGKDLKFNTTRKTFGSFCSTECRYTNFESTVEKRKNTCLEKYGANTYLTSQEGIKRTKEVCLEKFGVDSFSKTEEYRQFRKSKINQITP